MKLIIEDEEGRKTVIPFVREEISIGREEGNTIQLTERNVSRHHARLLRHNGSIQIEDLGSFNGIKVNGDRISGRSAIREGDLIEIGDYDLALEADSDSEPNGHDPRTTEPDLPVTPTNGRPEGSGRSFSATAVIRSPFIPKEPSTETRGLSPGEKPRLVLLNTARAGREFLVEYTEVTLGRGEEDNNFAIDHRSISKNHCKLLLDPDNGWRVVDLQSANGLKVNGEPYADAPITPGDILELGHVKLRFVGPGERYSLAAAREGTLQRRRKRLIGALVGATVVVAGGIAYFLLFLTPQVHRPTESTEVAVAPPPPPRAPLSALPAPAAAPTPPAPVVVKPVAEPEPAERPNDRKLSDLETQFHASLRAHRLAAAQAQLKAYAALAPDDADRLRKELDAAKPASRAEHRRERKVAAVAAAATPATDAVAASPENDKAERKARSKDAYDDGRALMAQADWIGAVSKFQEALELNGNYADAAKAMGICYIRLKEPEKGARFYEQYLKLRPDADDASQVRKMLADYYKRRDSE